MKISVVMPAYNAVGYLPQVLSPLVEMLRSGEVDEVLLVDDRSTDNTAALAEEMGARVLVMPENGGPGAARNMAAREAAGDVLWFVDSDVIAWPGGAERIRAAMADPTVHAVFGSYDETPAGQQWISKYKNLTHRYHHQIANREASTFWAGCGAVRKDAFLEIGGFDVETYRVPSIEDIELGYRIRSNGGRIIVLPSLLGKHLKVWTVGNVIHTDIFRRALPWARLMIAREGVTNDLNTSTDERMRALLAGVFLLSVLGLVVMPSSWLVTLLIGGAALAANWSFFQFLRKAGGVPFALVSIGFHQVYYVYSAVAFVWCLFEYHVLGWRDRLSVP